MPKRELIGTVVSNKMSKTIVIAVQLKIPHLKYGKVLLKTRRYMAHDELEQAMPGSTVVIVEHRPMSKNKCWSLKEIIKTQDVL